MMRTFALLAVFSAILLAWVLRAAAQQDNPDALLDQIDNLYEQGKYQEAIPLTEQVVAIYEKSLGPEHPAVATILNNPAELYRIQGRHSEAELRYKQSLEIKKRLEPDHPDMPVTLNNLALLYKTQGRYHEAEPLYKRSLEIDEQT